MTDQPKNDRYEFQPNAIGTILRDKLCDRPIALFVGGDADDNINRYIRAQMMDDLVAVLKHLSFQAQTSGSEHDPGLVLAINRAAAILAKIEGTP